jgi:cob(I)alamin adenosyltransferase
MKIYTKTGDKGETGFLGGRVSKASSLIHVVGGLDELHANLGVVVAVGKTDPNLNLGSAQLTQLLQDVEKIQGHMLYLGGLVADPQLSYIKADITQRLQAWTSELETAIDKFEQSLPQLTNFILLGGSVIGAELHRSRTVCRRTERELVGYIADLQATNQTTNPNYLNYLNALQLGLQYLNRLSDYLFTAARFVNAELKQPETIWHNN